MLASAIRWRGLSGGTIVLVLGLAASGCEGVARSLGLAGPTIEAPPARPVAAADVAVFDRAAVGAVVERLRGAPAETIARDLLVAGSDKILPEAEFRYDGFALRQIKFLDQETTTDGGRRLTALLHFEDPAARDAAAIVGLVYRPTTAGIELAEAAWRPLYAAHPRTAMFVVRADALLDAASDAGRDYRSLYRFARANAIPMRGPQAASTESGDYVILVFMFDRLEPGAEFSVRLSDRRNSAGGFSAATRYVLFDDGWAVAVIPGRFALADRGAFWVKAVHRPGPAAPDAGTGERVVGLFRSAPVR